MITFVFYFLIKMKGKSFFILRGRKQKRMSFLSEAQASKKAIIGFITNILQILYLIRSFEIKRKIL